MHEIEAFLGFMPAAGSSSSKRRGSSQGPRDFKTALRSVGQTARKIVKVRQGDDPVGQLTAFFPGFQLLRGKRTAIPRGPSTRAMTPHVAADHDVFEHGHMLGETDILEGAGHAAPTDIIGLQSLDALSVKDDVAFLGVNRPAR